MASLDLLRLKLTNQTAFDQGDPNLIPKFECPMYRRCQVLVSKLETLNAITFT